MEIFIVFAALARIWFADVGRDVFAKIPVHLFISGQKNPDLCYVKK